MPAKDKASTEVLKSEPDLASQKLSWLKRHDKESGDLYGMLPLCYDMPVCLTDHLDRSRDKNLLRGTRGRVVGWVCHDDDEVGGATDLQERVLTKLPIAVLVKFDGAKWTLHGLDEGVYPIRPVSRDWFLDKYRRPAVLKVARKQLPLAPGFAITAHASQGATLEAAIVDMQVPNTASWISLYVALSRVRRADDLLIFRAFDGAVMQQGDPLGPSTLLKKLRGDYIDKDELHHKLSPPKKCSICNEMLSAMFFLPEQWFGHAKAKRVCIVCTRDGAPCMSSHCDVRIKGEEAWDRKALAKRFCVDCCRARRGKHTCSLCDAALPPKGSIYAYRKMPVCMKCYVKAGKRECNSCGTPFAPGDVIKGDAYNAICTACWPTFDTRDLWLCSGCREKMSRSRFNKVMLGDDEKLCSECEKQNRHPMGV